MTGRHRDGTGATTHASAGVDSRHHLHRVVQLLSIAAFDEVEARAN